MESDGDAEPYLSGSYEEFVVALISLHDHPCSERLCVLIAALDPKAYIFLLQIFISIPLFLPHLSTWTE